MHPRPPPVTSRPGPLPHQHGCCLLNRRLAPSSCFSLNTPSAHASLSSRSIARENQLPHSRPAICPSTSQAPSCFPHRPRISCLAGLSSAWCWIASTTSHRTTSTIPSLSAPGTLGKRKLSAGESPKSHKRIMAVSFSPTTTSLPAAQHDFLVMTALRSCGAQHSPPRSSLPATARSASLC